jgi:drug/metabolite transporter (DMT)-like permease
MGEKITLNKVIGIVLVVTGVLILVTKGRLSTLLSISFAPGDALMLLAAFTFATYNILLRRRPKEMSFWTLQASTFTIIGATKAAMVYYSMSLISGFLLIVPGHPCGEYVNR